MPRQYPRYIKYLKKLLLLEVIIALIVLQTAVHAQTGSETWTTPINLSSSGGATAPNMVVDANGMIHAVWVDEYDGSIYSQYDGQQWIDPLAVIFPFQGAQPLLVPEPGGLIHAFWLNEDNQLFHRVHS